METSFQEVQKFTPWWLWVLLIGIGFIPVLEIYQQLILGQPFGDKPMPDVGLLLLAVFVFCLIALFWSMQLKIEFA